MEGYSLNDIAIIGIGGIFPEADNVFQFYENLLNGKDCVRELSKKRKGATGISVDADSRLIAYIEDIDKFDHSFFSLLPGEAQYISPLHRLLLQVVYHTIENAGYNPDHLSGTKTSVFVGAADCEYRKMASKDDSASLLHAGNLNASISGRISRFFNLLGNSVVVDTACSSSLVALHMACNEILLGESEMALVCGAHLIIDPGEKSYVFESGIMSKSGKTRSFSALADGTGSGEGVACVLLKPLHKALRDKDNIQAIIKGSAVNQDAQRSSTLNAPSSIAQSEVIKEAWKKAGIDPSTITYIEAHGTATAIGDPIELEGISLAFGDISPKQFCAISSVKSNIGHTDSAAGMLGLIKAILAIKNRKIFPTVHFEEPTPYFDFLQSPLYVSIESENWEPLTTFIRRAGVSSFGFSGTNCHVVLEENLNRFEKLTPVEGSFIIPFSSQTKEGLMRNMTAVLRFLEQGDQKDISAVSYTLSQGRKHFPVRKALIVKSVDDLIVQLRRGITDNYSPVQKCVANELWFVFSENIQIEQEVVSELRNYDLFKKHYDEYCYIEGQFSEVFAFQFALYKLFEDLKITSSKKLLGHGAGKMVIDCITGKRSINDAFFQACQEQEKSSLFTEARIKEFVKGKLSVEGGAIIEMGVGGSVCDAIKKYSNARVFGLKNEGHGFLSLIREIYESGIDLNWAGLFTDGTRVELPGYEFQKNRCWLRSELKDDVDTWLYNLKWKEVPVSKKKEINSNRILFFSDKIGLTESLIKSSILFRNSIVISQANDFRKLSENNYLINFSDADHYMRLADCIKKEDISAIIHLSSLGESESFNLTNSLYSQFYICTSLNDVFAKGIDFISVTANSRLINAEDKLINPSGSALHGFVAALGVEYPKSSFKCIDVSLADDISEISKSLELEATTSSDNIIVGYRNRKRLVPVIDKIHTSYYKGAKVRLKENGNYLVTGGASGVGLEVIKRFAIGGNKKFFVLGRRYIPSKDKWDVIVNLKNNKHHSIINEFKLIESLGCEVHYFQVDISDKIALSNVFMDFQDKNVSINGIFHSAGIPGNMRVKAHTWDTFNEVLKPKIHGSCYLYELSKGFKLDFFILFSSNNSIRPGFKAANYSAANMFQDNYVHFLREQGLNAISINWPSWRETGIWKRFYDRTDLSDSHYKQSILTEDGLNALEIIMEGNWSNVIVSNKDPNHLGVNPYFEVPEEFKTSGNNIFNELSSSPNELSQNNYLNGQFSYTENALMQIWLTVLKLPEINIDDNFFGLGGHSLLGTRIINRIETEFEADIEFRDLMRFPTIRLMAEYLNSFSEGNGNLKKQNVIPSVDPLEFYKLSHAQLRIWILSQSLEGNIAYNIPLSYVFAGNLNTVAFKKAIESTIERHEILRTTFHLYNEEPHQKIHGSMDTPFIYRDLSRHPEKYTEVRKLASIYANEPLDLQKGPVLKMTLVKIDEEEHYFIVVIHHIVADGWSTGILVKEIIQLYNAYSAGQENPFSPLRIQYKDYSCWQNKMVSGEEYSGHRTYWMDKLKGDLPRLKLPYDAPRPKVKSFVGDSVFFNIDRELTSQVYTICKDSDVSLFMFLLSATKVLLHKYSLQQDVIIGCPVAGREHKDLEDQIGFYVNTLAIRTSIFPQDRFSDVLIRIRENVLDAYKYQAYPFDKLVSDLKINVNPSHSPLFDVMIQLLNTDEAGPDLTMNNIEAKYSGYNADLSFSKFDLVFNFREVYGELTVEVRFNSDLFLKETILILKERLLILLKDITENPLKEISQLVFSTKFESETLSDNLEIKLNI